MCRLCKPFNRSGNNLLFGHASPTYYNPFQELYNDPKLIMFWKVSTRFDPLIIPTSNMRDSRETQFSNGNFMLEISKDCFPWTTYLHFQWFRSKCNSQTLWQVLNFHLAHLLLHSQERKRGGPITHRSQDRNLALIVQRITSFQFLSFVGKKLGISLPTPTFLHKTVLARLWSNQVV